MSAKSSSSHEAIDDRLARRNAVVLAVTQALAGANNSVIIATGGIVGAMLAPDRSLATLPVTIYVLGLWIGTLPIGWLARHYGRRTAFQIGTISGVITGLLCCLGVLKGSFLIFCAGAFCSGLYAAAHQGYRFAAADTASDAFKPKAISWVLLGGVFAGIVGPQLIILTKDMWQPYLFAASYIGQSLIAVLAAGVSVVRQNSDAADAAGRSEGAFARRNSPPAAFCRRRRVRDRKLRDDEHGDDRGAARDGRLQSFGHRRHARPAMACDRDVLRRASSPAA